MAELIATSSITDGDTEFSIEGFELKENSGYSLVSVASRRGKEAEVSEAAAQKLGLPLPEPGKATRSPNAAAFWTAPDQWFLEAPMDHENDFEAKLKSVFRQNASITDQTGGWARFDMSGHKIVATFERLCVVDLATMAADSVSRTAIDHVGCFVITNDNGLSVLAPRSYAGSVFHAITVAAESL